MGAPEPKHKGEFTFSPYTHHFSHNPEHKKVVLVAVDEQLPGNRLCGVSLFSNSFGQPSVYVYAGQQFNNLWGNPKAVCESHRRHLVRLCGPIQRTKFPSTTTAFRPPSSPRWATNLTEHDSVQLKFLGTAALMFSYGRQF
jgi:hypothetical protein